MKRRKDEFVRRDAERERAAKVRVDAVGESSKVNGFGERRTGMDDRML